MVSPGNRQFIIFQMLCSYRGCCAASFMFLQLFHKDFSKYQLDFKNYFYFYYIQGELLSSMTDVRDKVDVSIVNFRCWYLS